MCERAPPRDVIARTRAHFHRSHENIDGMVVSSASQFAPLPRVTPHRRASFLRSQA
jgi:hypothetical protein